MLFSQAASINLCATDALLQHLATRALCVVSIHTLVLLLKENSRGWLLTIILHNYTKQKRTKTEKSHFSFAIQDLSFNCFSENIILRRSNISFLYSRCDSLEIIVESELCKLALTLRGRKKRAREIFISLFQRRLSRAATNYYGGENIAGVVCY